MKDETDTAVHAVFQELITSLQIRGVQFIEIQSKRSSATFAPEDSNGETSISWKQLFPPDDPLRVEDTLLASDRNMSLSSHAMRSPFTQR